MSILASRMAAVLKKALVIIAYEWAPIIPSQEAEKHRLIVEGERVLEDYVQRTGQR